jgi:hypothetical protein
MWAAFWMMASANFFDIVVPIEPMKAFLKSWLILKFDSVSMIDP